MVDRREVSRFRPIVRREAQPHGFSALQVANAVEVFDSITIPEHLVVTHGEAGPTLENILAAKGFLQTGAEAFLPTDRKGRSVVTKPPTEIGLRELRDATSVYRALQPDISHATTALELRDPEDETPETIIDAQTIQLIEEQLEWRRTLAEDWEGAIAPTSRVGWGFPLPGERRREQQLHQRLIWGSLNIGEQTDARRARRQALEARYLETYGRSISQEE